MVGHTIAVHDGRKHVPGVHHRVDGRSQARRVRPHPHVPVPRRPGAQGSAIAMTFGVKTNERPGTRAQVRHVRVSAYKAREVLDLIRGEQVARALEILEFSERDVAQVILKCLESAIANAEHNDQIPADELFVSACFADEGPTLKRWRPRARGRATRIRKRTCHITVIVSRLAPEELERIRAREVAVGRPRWRPGRRRGPSPARAAQPGDQGRAEGRRGRGRARARSRSRSRGSRPRSRRRRRVTDEATDRRGRRPTSRPTPRPTPPRPTTDEAEADRGRPTADETDEASGDGDDADAEREDS